MIRKLRTSAQYWKCDKYLITKSRGERIKPTSAVTAAEVPCVTSVVLVVDSMVNAQAGRIYDCMRKSPLPVQKRFAGNSRSLPHGRLELMQANEGTTDRIDGVAAVCGSEPPAAPTQNSTMVVSEVDALSENVTDSTPIPDVALVAD